MIDLAPFGQLVRRYRLESELTQEALAERAGLSVRAVRDIEAGGKHRPRRDTIDLLVNALDVPATERSAFLDAARAGEPAEATRPDPIGGREHPPIKSTVDQPLGVAPAGEDQFVSRSSLPLGRFLGALPTGLLVARREELERIRQVVNATVSGQSRLVLLTGEPGVGKTRLAQEVTAELLNRDALIGTGRCYEPEQSVPYFALHDALTSLLHASPPPLRAEIPMRWPFLCKLFPGEFRLPAPLESGGQDEELLLFQAVSGFLAALSQYSTVAILLDDLHWADTSTLRLLLYLARHLPSSPVLLLGTYRDVEVGRQHPLEGALRDLHREGLVERVHLRRLDEHDTGSLIAETMGETEVTEEFRALIQERTEGNPFFVQQVLRALIERGDVFRRDGRWDRKSIAEIEVPESIRSVIGQRVTRLAEPTQELLRVASIFGQRFQFDELLAVVQLAETDVERALDEAVAAGLMVTTDGESYIFDHALTQQTLYTEVSARRRRRLHAEAASAIEAHSAGRNTELAWHFLQADDPARALPCSLGAGDAALEVFAWSEAETQYRTAVQLAEELGDKRSEAVGRRKIGDLLISMGRFDEAIECLEKAAEAYLATGDLEPAALAIAYMSNDFFFKGQLARGIDVLQRLIDRYPDVHSSPGLDLVRSYRDLWDAWMRAAFPEALTVAEMCLAAARRVDDARSLAICLAAKGIGLRLNGRPMEARVVLEESIETADRIRDPFTQLMCTICLAELYLLTARWAEAVDVIERAIILAERVHNLPHSAYVRSHLGLALTKLGRWTEARRELEQSVSLVRSVEQGWHSAGPFCRLIELCILDGLWDEADRLLAELVPIVQSIDDLQWMAIAEGHWAELQLRRGNPARVLTGRLFSTEGENNGGMRAYTPVLQSTSLVYAHLATGAIDEAQRLIDQSLPAIRKMESAPNLIPWLRASGAVLAHQRKCQEAEAAFEEAVEVPHSLSMPYEEAQALYEWGEMLHRAGQSERAGEKLRVALEIFTRLGAGYDIDRATKVLQRAGDAPQAG